MSQIFNEIEEVKMCKLDNIEFRKELPKSNVGKILRKDLRAEVLSQVKS